MTKQTKVVTSKIRPEELSSEDNEGLAPPVETPAPPVNAATPPPYPVKIVPDKPTPQLDENGDPIEPEAPAPAEKPKPAETPKPEPEVITIPGIEPEQYAAFQKELGETGKLSDSSYKTLLAAGYPKAVVDAQLANHAAAAAHTESQVFKAVGNKDEWAKTYAPWAKENLTPEQIAEFDAAIQTSDPSQWSKAISRVKQLHDEAVGTDARVELAGRRPAASAAVAKPFPNAAAFQQAIADPRWLKDAEYTIKVRARGAASRAAGIPLT